MGNLRDYEEWHSSYDNPESGLSWRLRIVQQYVREALERHPGQIRILSLCAGEGRDVLGVLPERADADRVQTTLLELHPQIAQRARDAATAAGLHQVEVRTVDAGNTDSYVGAVPADLVLLVGIFGNLGDTDVQRLIRAAPQLCRPGATLLWSRGRDLSSRGGDETDLNDDVRTWFSAAGFTELDYAARDSGSRPALGAMRYDGPAQPLVPGRQLFTFVR
jgi:hypothetical protein